MKSQLSIMPLPFYISFLYYWLFCVFVNMLWHVLSCPIYPKSCIIMPLLCGVSLRKTVSCRRGESAYELNWWDRMFGSKSNVHILWLFCRSLFYYIHMFVLTCDWFVETFWALSFAFSAIFVMLPSRYVGLGQRGGWLPCDAVHSPSSTTTYDLSLRLSHFLLILMAVQQILQKQIPYRSMGSAEEEQEKREMKGIW